MNGVEKTFIYFVFERVRIYYRKEIMKRKPPWTTDKILQKYRFCNVCREHDRTSRYLIENWYLPNYNNNDALKVVVSIARIINYEPTLSEIGFPEFDGNKVSRKWIDNLKSVFNKRKLSREKIRSDAYYVYSRGYRLLPLIEKIVIPNTEKIKLECTFKKTWQSYMKISHISSFIAGQFCKDLTYSTDYAKSWPDRNLFAAPGNGSLSGIEFLFGVKLKPLRWEEDLHKFCVLVMETKELLESCGFSEAFPEVASKMDLMDYQNCLCEFSKYWKIFNGMKFRGRLYRYRE